MRTNMHRCHAKGCPRWVPFERLMCRTHWFMVRAQTRSKVWAAWNRGSSAEHAEATAEAVAQVEAIERARRPRASQMGLFR